MGKYHYRSEFIILSDKKIIKNDLYFLFSTMDSFCCFKTKKHIVAYCQAEETNWVNIVRGPRHFWMIPEDFYYEMVSKINEGNYVSYSRIHNAYGTRIEMFKNAIQYNGCEIFKEKKRMT